MSCYDNCLHFVPDAGSNTTDAGCSTQPDVPKVETKWLLPHKPATTSSSFISDFNPQLNGPQKALSVVGSNAEVVIPAEVTSSDSGVKSDGHEKSAEETEVQNEEHILSPANQSETATYNQVSGLLQLFFWLVATLVRLANKNKTIDSLINNNEISRPN